MMTGQKSDKLIKVMVVNTCLLAQKSAFFPNQVQNQILAWGELIKAQRGRPEFKEGPNI